MKKEDVLTKMATDAGITKKAASAALNSFMDGVMKTLEKGEKFSLVGFGTFEVRKRSARTGINPQNRKKIDIPEKKVPAFKAGKKLKEVCK